MVPAIKDLVILEAGLPLKMRMARDITTVEFYINNIVGQQQIQYIVNVKLLLK